MSDQGLSLSDSDGSRRDVPSFIYPRPPLILNPFMRPRPQNRTNLMDLFEDSDLEEAEWVQVYLRMKPCNNPSNLYEVKSDRCLITSVDTATAGHGRRTQHNVSKMYTFSHIFGPHSTQKDIFEQVVKENLKKLPEGHNFTLLAYGASGSGKTYTLMGTVASPGLVPRSLEYVFRIVDAAQHPMYKPSEEGADSLSHTDQAFELQWVRRLRHLSAPVRENQRYRRMSAQLRHDMTSTLNLANRTRYYIWVSFVEIYNEGIYDLLVNTDRSKATSKLRIREDSNGNAYVKGATQAFVRSGEEAYDVMVAGKHNLQVAATGVHANSSRSHCIFTITLLTETESGVRTSYVRLCDLAGSERARATRNTGARMMESRAINASLHVLERCLHMLRRKQKVDATLVPYRESKLTRLLGAGLSGARGEAVSMVVTVNPSPQYAHETKHVLQLAAVAKDIQVNHTIAETEATLETTQDTTVGIHEVMKLRAENERLHFELIQAQSSNKHLMATMAKEQQETAATMSELVQQAKDMTSKFYEGQLQMKRVEIEDLKEEYEARLRAAEMSSEVAKVIGDGGTPSKALQKKVAKLTMEITILEEKLANEKLARQRAEEEVQHLRACIEERDEKTEDNSSNEKEDTVESGTDESSDHEANTESLEPSFRKQDINRSKLLRKSLNRSNLANDYVSLKQLGIEKFNESLTIHDADDTINDSIVKDSSHLDDDSVLEVSNDTIKDDDNDEIRVYKSPEISREMNESCNSENSVLETNATNNSGYVADNSTSRDNEGNKDTIHKTDELYENSKDCYNRSDMEHKRNDNKASSEHSQTRATYFVRESQSLNSSQDSTKSTGRETYFVEDEPVITNNKPGSSASSLTRGTFVVAESEIFNTSELNKSKNTSNSSSTETYVNQNKPALDAMVKYTDPVEFKKYVEEKIPISSIEEKVLITDPEKVENKILFSKRQNQNSDVSLAQFEQLEIAANSVTAEKKITNIFSVKNNSEEKPNCYDKRTSINLITVKPKDKKIYFENTKAITEEANLNEERSPSIVKDDVAENFEPSTIKKLLGESFSRPEILPNHVTLSKKNYSLDLFAELDSPGLVKTNMDTEVLKTNLKVNNDAIINIEHTKSTCEAQDTDKKRDMEVAHKIETNKNVLSNELANEPSNAKKDNLLNIVIKKEKIDFEFVRPYNEKPRAVSILETCVEKGDVSKMNDSNKLIEDTRKCIDNMVLNQKSHMDKEIKIKVERTSVSEFDEPKTSDYRAENTLDEFENIVKTVTPRTTEFELLVQHSGSVYVDETTDHKTEAEKRIADKKSTEFEKVKYNLRHKHNVSEEKSEPQESKTEKKTKKSLRLRRRKNETDETIESKIPEKDSSQLKNIVNLQKEFSDVTLDVPAIKKVVKDIPSPEKSQDDQENLPPQLGIQSCPSKSLTRSRRKLFTPRAEPLEESLTQSGSADERVRVPRPSYHRPRARRKL